MLAILKQFKKVQLFSVLFLMKEDNQRHYPYCVNHTLYIHTILWYSKLRSPVMSSLTRLQCRRNRSGRSGFGRYTF